MMRSPRLSFETVLNRFAVPVEGQDLASERVLTTPVELKKRDRFQRVDHATTRRALCPPLDAIGCSTDRAISVFDDFHPSSQR